MLSKQFCNVLERFEWLVNSQWHSVYWLDGQRNTVFFLYFLCIMFIIKNNHEQNLLQFLAGCELLSTPWTSDFLHSKNRSKLCRSKRTKRTNLWRLETARNWNFWNFETWFSFEHFGCWALMNQEFLLPKYANHFGWGTWCNSQTAMTPWTFRDLVWMRFPRCLGVVLSVADGGFCVFGVRFGYPNRLPVDWFIG
jgi:hypothetical protein